MSRAALGAALILSAALAGGCTPDYSTSQADYVPLALRVPSDYETVTEALLASLPGDTVLVAAGTYEESYVPLAAGVLLRGETGRAADVVIDALGDGPVLNALGLDEPAWVEHLTLTGGLGQYAGGVRIDSTTVTLRDCVIAANVSKTGGGGVTCGNYGEVILEDCLISRNSADAWRGGGLWLGGASTAVLRRCTITGNSAPLGGGLYCGSGADVTVSGGAVTGNLGRTQGGGVYLEGWGDFRAEGLLVGGNISAIGPDGVFNANSPTEELSAVLRCCDLDPAKWLGAEGLVLDEADCP